MLEISSSAAALIQDACDEFDLGDESGARIFPSPQAEDDRTLEVRYVNGPQPKDQVIERGHARVFVAQEIAMKISTLVLDTDGRDEEEERLILRVAS